MLETSMTWVVALYIFMLAAFTGYELIRRVPAILHTPLMSGADGSPYQLSRSGGLGAGACACACACGPNAPRMMAIRAPAAAARAEPEAVNLSRCEFMHEPLD